MIPCLSSAFTCQAIITLIVYPTTFIDLAIPSITFFSDLFILEQHLHYTGSASYRPFMRGAIRQFGPPPPAGCLSFPALKVIDIRFFPCVGRRRWKPLLQRFHFPPPHLEVFSYVSVIPKQKFLSPQRFFSASHYHFFPGPLHLYIIELSLDKGSRRPPFSSFTKGLYFPSAIPTLTSDPTNYDA